MEKRWRYGVRGLADNVTATTPNRTVSSGLQAGAELVILMYYEGGYLPPNATGVTKATDILESG